MNFTSLLYFLLAITLLSGTLALYTAVPRASAQRALRWLFAGLMVTPVANSVPAIYHCELDGRVTYQDTRCQLDAITLRVMPILKPPPAEVKTPAEAMPAEPAAVTVLVPGASSKAAEILEPKTPVVRGTDQARFATEQKPAIDSSKPGVDAKNRIVRIEQSQSSRAQRSAEVRTASAECQGILGQIATQKELLHSLRAETRTQAKAKVAELARDLQQRC